MKKVTVLFLSIILIMTVILSGCSSKDNNGGASSNSDSSSANNVKDVKIGVILYNYTDIQGKELKNYCDNYLMENFPVTFEYQTAVANDNEAHLAAVDSLISTGCNAIMSGYDTVIGEAMEKCNDAGVYYGILFGEGKNESDQDGKYNQYGNWGTAEQSNLYYSDYFLGGIYQFGEDHGYEIGKTYAKAVIGSGGKKVGAISFPIYAFSDGVTITQGFVEVLEASGIEICPDTNTGNLPAEAGFATVGEDTKAYIANYKDMDTIFGLSSGMDMVLPAINETGRLWSIDNKIAGAIRIASLGYNESSRQYMEKGTLAIGGTNNYVQSVAYLFTLVFDAVNGNNWKTSDSLDFNMNGTINYPTFTNIDELNDFETYMLTTVNNDFSKCSVTAEELKGVMKSYDGTGSYKELTDIISRSVDKIKAVRK